VVAKWQSSEALVVVEVRLGPAGSDWPAGAKPEPQPNFPTVIGQQHDVTQR
jgi:hypothetical protein